MKTCVQTDYWIHFIFIVLGSILVLSLVGVVFLILIIHIVPEILVALGIVAGAGLAKLFISPLNQRLYE